MSNTEDVPKENVSEEVPNLMLNKNSNFFIALAKKSSDFHNFVMVGVQDDNGTVQLLARLGKGFFANGSYVKSLFSREDKVFVFDEGITRKHNRKTPISYSAYSINYQQYLQFITILDSFNSINRVQEDDKLRCYRPVSENINENTVELKYTSEEINENNVLDNVQIDTTKLNNLTEKGQYISLKNTCKNTAIDIINYVRGDQKLSSEVSEVFFQGLPLKTKLVKGVPDPKQHFYILPPPPTCNIEDETKQFVLNKLYRRMEEMLKIEPNSAATVEKFNKLKDLYLQQFKDPNQPIETFLNNIKTWRQENAKIVTAHRSKSIFISIFKSFIKSKTEKLFDEIENHKNKPEDNKKSH